MKKETGRRFPDRWKVGRIKFTMIELLIVISIIMILASLFLPALQKARLHALSTNCIANLRGIGQAFSIYQMEFNDLLPVQSSIPRYYPQIPLKSFRCPAIKVVSLKDPAESYGIRCAEMTNTERFVSNFDYYQQNKVTVSNPGGEPIEFLKAGRFRKPSALLLATDSLSILKKQNSKMHYNSGRIFFHHQQRTSALFLDGHSGSFSFPGLLTAMDKSLDNFTSAWRAVFLREDMENFYP